MLLHSAWPRVLCYEEDALCLTTLCEPFKFKQERMQNRCSTKCSCAGAGSQA